ncbi:MAG: PTS mannose/fructose/sorbose transporter subunit IIB [Elusimicrobia bacterium CG08_land_8_20_14_0_20_59_10]|nr:MAG: PTS mannose/fructose/sorbose transporter subunit IIB [Elusimicrobia bacterium CG08_land_8_20_14_0_20_59_10]
MLVLYRVDDRLVHGQVAEGWVPHLKADELAVVSDEIAADPLRRDIMRFATPEGVDLRIMTVEQAAEYLPQAETSARKVLLLLPGLAEALALLGRGMKFTSLNIGGMHYSAGKNLSIGKAIFLNDEDCAALKALAAAGIKIEGRGVPSDTPLDLLGAIA